VLAFRYPLKAALTVSASLAQIGEFSFILAALGVTMGVLEPEAQSLVLAGSLISIMLNPLVFATIGPVRRFVRRRPALAAFIGRLQHLPDTDESIVDLRDHVILIGYGRASRVIVAELTSRGVPLVVIEQNQDALRSLEGGATPYVFGDATNPETLALANPTEARLLIIAIPDALQAGRVLALARLANPKIDSAVRTHSEGELQFIRKRGPGLALMAEHELALGLARYALEAYGVNERRPKSGPREAAAKTHYRYRRVVARRRGGVRAQAARVG
jgi:CPA2 family monovalent cation:H+ antiporter-2